MQLVRRLDWKYCKTHRRWKEKEKGQAEYGRDTGRNGSNLCTILVYPFKNSAVCRSTEATWCPFLLLVLISLAKFLLPEIEGISKWYVGIGS